MHSDCPLVRQTPVLHRACDTVGWKICGSQEAPGNVPRFSFLAEAAPSSVHLWHKADVEKLP